MTGRCARAHTHTHTDRQTNTNERIISAIHFVHLAEIIIRVVTFELYQPIWPQVTTVTNGQRDRRTTYEVTKATPRFVLRASCGKNRLTQHPKSVNAVHCVPTVWRKGFVEQVLSLQRRFGDLKLHGTKITVCLSAFIFFRWTKLRIFYYKYRLFFLPQNAPRCIWRPGSGCTC